MHTWSMQGRKAYVHCWGGVGRTGIVAGCYLIEHGHYTGEAALAQLQLLWRRMSADKQRRKPHTPETEAQRRYVLNWAQQDLRADKGDLSHELV
ncbi:protein-tyrosine phosphatase family protein [Aquabacterium sp.]|uniref:protein-tyrosine phosphatase family protein n=1 Tax=Aquabacterium sp. TaxID=1872578 RepID=UPI003D080585